jgi:hypothetical protein
VLTVAADFLLDGEDDIRAFPAGPLEADSFDVRSNGDFPGLLVLVFQLAELARMGFYFNIDFSTMH